MLALDDDGLEFDNGDNIGGATMGKDNQQNETMLAPRKEFELDSDQPFIEMGIFLCTTEIYYGTNILPSTEENY